MIIVQLAVLLCAILVCLRKRSHVPTEDITSTSSKTGFSSSSKKSRRHEKNITPIPERKNSVTHAENTKQKEYLDEKERRYDSNSKSVNHTLKKHNTTDGFNEMRRRDSLSSLPLVLRNDYLRRHDAYKSKQNMKPNSPIRTMYGQEQEPDVYFTPHYGTAIRKGDRNIYTIDNNEYKLNGEMKSYFDKNFEVDNNTFDSYQDT